MFFKKGEVRICEDCGGKLKHIRGRSFKCTECDEIYLEFIVD